MMDFQPRRLPVFEPVDHKAATSPIIKNASTLPNGMEQTAQMGITPPVKASVMKKKP